MLFRSPDTFHVVETSSFQLEQIDTFHPWIAVMLNVSPDHLDRHPDVEAYAAAKTRVFENQDSRDWAVVNADDPTVLALARKGRAAIRLFARSGSIAFQGSTRCSSCRNRSDRPARRPDPSSGVRS